MAEIGYGVVDSGHGVNSGNFSPPVMMQRIRGISRDFLILLINNLYLKVSND